MGKEGERKKEMEEKMNEWRKQKLKGKRNEGMDYKAEERGK